jgi:archaellum component FlaC
LNSTDSAQGNYVIVREKSNSGNSGAAAMSLDVMDDDSVQAHFNEIKPLIIKSAEIIEAYYEAINMRLESIYVAQSDFGSFAEKTSQDIEATSTSTTQQFENMQVVITEMDGEIGSLESDLLNISEEFSYTQRDIVEINSNIQTIDEEVVSLSSEVIALDDEVKTVEENVGSLDTDLQGVKSNVQGVASEVEGVKTEVEGTKTGVQNVATEVENVKSSVGSNLQVIEEDIDKVGSDLEGLKENTEANIQGLNESLGAVGNDLDKVDSELQGFKEEASNDLKGIKDEIENIKYIIVDVNAYIKSGLLYSDANGLPVYGLEIGQRNNVNGVEIFNKFARFTSDRLSFYDQNDIEVAYISDKKLYISDVEVLRSFKIGGIKKIVLANGDIVKKWVGGEG